MNEEIERLVTRLSPAQVEVAYKYAAGAGTYVELAEHVGVTRHTVYRWTQNEPDFVELIRLLKLEVHTQFMARVTHMADAAVQRLSDMIGQTVDAPISHSDQLKAIKLVFDMKQEELRTETLLKEIEHLRGMLNAAASIQPTQVSLLEEGLEPTPEADADGQ